MECLQGEEPVKLFQDMRYEMDWRAFRIAVRQSCVGLELRVPALAREIGMSPTALANTLANRPGGIHVRVVLAVCAHLGINPVHYVKAKE